MTKRRDQAIMTACDSIRQIRFSLRRRTARRLQRARRRRRAVEPTPAQSPLNYQSFPSWARVDLGAQEESRAAFFAAGASLALLDRALRTGGGDVEPVFAGALRQRLALKAAASCARLARLREDECGLRDGEHLAPVGAPPSPAGRLHRLFRLFGGRSLQHDAATLALAAEQLELRPAAATVDGLAAALREIATNAGPPSLPPPA